MKRQLPPGLRARSTTSGNTFYYLKLFGTSQEMPLGRDKRPALQQWQQSQLAAFIRERSVDDLVTLVDCFVECVIPVREPGDRLALLKQAKALRQYFVELGNPPPESLSAGQDTYLEYHGPAQCHRAGAEIYLFCHIWRWAQLHALLPHDTPCPWHSRDAVSARQREILIERCEAVQQLRTSSPREAAAGEASQNQASLNALRQRIAAQLLADGRRDIARHLTSLPPTEFATLLSQVSGAPSATAKSSLILGTRRATSLQELRQNALRIKRKLYD